MDRREFLEKAFGLTVVSAVTPGILTCACEAAAKDLPLAFTTFTIDINQKVKDQEPPPLTIIGGSMIVTSPARLLIIRTDEQTFSALTSRCPHQGVIVGLYDPGVGRITCPQHGSQFDKFGGLLRGPAPIGLARYTAEFDGDHTVTISDTLMDVELESLRATVIERIHPNPFTDKTTIDISIAEAVGIELAIFDIESNKLATVFDGPLDIGKYDFTFDGSALPAGSYFCKLTSAKGSVVQQIHIIR